ncbi:glycerophosphodiester phosphodiesterase domain-containing protein 5 isoform X1 [Alligator mississippiensis]|uniref:Glycerophosphodiester phosphodiesterase domain-containing protein 5 n=1 Tax=Alligator mississippiensis TaxID=8496 RepID=A0A151M3V1_ALLMI|nr:glycerophosphodiester phosphodiesterase domain-containing protein 5 isoform X1 [Alligator mississippiensis]XP_014456994.1 glycerophosphodiester phosphodiesterase domain-containing protein 5 isoform X1 [Alligator mississippiensis]XP_019334927.1 glycerophosphodiester phosphodiesterase domain-containing protein 5 isoform X1 [Alligator mississippiensis]KYO19195.1 glycerophosphodiester phosphodiesterase domain-containing protein 5 [Alligator mississippiensis]
MVKHQPLQYYEPQLCLSCLTGIYGCRWKRYQRSHDDTTKWERLWFLILTFTFFLTLIWFYFWWEVHNDYNEINWFLYNRMGYWSDWSIPILITTAAGFTYVTALLILALCHIAVGQQMNLHWLHKIGLIVTLIATVITMSSIAQLWDDEWEMVVISLQATAPFLHIGALAAVTALSWLIAGQFARTEKATSQMLTFTAYFAVVVALYLVPLTISSPCIMEKKDLGPKPAIIGHRGAPMLAPENTLMSFQKAVEQKIYGVQADVVISYDGVPFLMHDETLRRTTNVEEVFPELAYKQSSMFNWTDLEKLNAGGWFLKDDPFWTAGALSASDYVEAGNQSVCKLEDMLQIIKDNTSLILNFQNLPPDHPYHSTYINITLETILMSGIQQQAVMWMPDMERQLVRQIAPGFQQTSGIKAGVERLREKGIKKLNLRYTKVTSEDIREYATANLSTNLYTVNEPWLYSILWCAGVQSVTSDSSHILSKVPFPIWILPPDEYCLIWITSDIISFTIIVGVFIFQKWRLGSIRTYNPEQIMLSAAVRRSSRDVKIMKEKLIFSEINNGGENTDELSLCSENGYSNEVVTPMDHRDMKLRMD